MRIQDEFVPEIATACEVVFSWIYQCKHTLYALHKSQDMIYKFQNSSVLSIPLEYKPGKMAYNPISGLFLASAQNFMSDSVAIYFCNEQFKKIDAITTFSAESCKSLSDIWYDESMSFVWIVTGQNIYRYNLNGDCLGCFMSATKGTTYHSLCTCKNFIFVSYEKKGCFYVASYTRDGVFLERVSLGNEYTLCNMQAITQEDELVLRVYAIKQYHMQYFIDIELEKLTFFPTADVHNIKVDCQSEDSTIIATCNINN